MGKYDIPATINYILAQSGRDKLIYCGQSMGGAIFFIAMITYPELNDKIEMMVCHNYNLFDAGQSTFSVFFSVWFGASFIVCTLQRHSSLFRSVCQPHAGVFMNHVMQISCSYI